MKNFALIFLFILALGSGCQQASEISHQLSFINSLVKEYGGQWNGSALQECYELEIKNSKILTPKTDSLEYYSTIIGRAFIDSLNYNFPCIKFELIDETSVGIASKSSSIEAVFDLTLIRRFKDKKIEEYLTIRKAYYAIKHAYQGNISEAKPWLEDLNNNELQNPFVILAQAEILRANNQIEESRVLIDSISSQYPKEGELHKYLSFYFIEVQELDQALKHLQMAVKTNTKNVDFLSNIAGLHKELQNWDSVYFYTSKLIEIDTMSINAYYSRAYSSFQMNNINKGCHDLAQVSKLDPTIVLADSISNYCN